ncbi:MAG TPA: hypothetical protein VGQ95_10775 [Chthoniobacterales bacterium]|nr:hypothetical protein [Chthoniobacterales bacterium]
MRIQVLTIAVLLSGCASPPLQIAGPYAARLSESDVQHIKLVVSARPHIDHRIRKLEAVRPDRVHVESGHIDSLGGWKGSGFFVVKRGDKWFIDESSGFEATVERTIVTD